MDMEAEVGATYVNMGEFAPKPRSRSRFIVGMTATFLLVAVCLVTVTFMPDGNAAHGASSSSKLSNFGCSATADQCAALFPKAHFEPSCLKGGLGCHAAGKDCCQYCGAPNYPSISCQDDEPTTTTKATTTKATTTPATTTKATTTKATTTKDTTTKATTTPATTTKATTTKATTTSAAGGGGGCTDVAGWRSSVGLTCSIIAKYPNSYCWRTETDSQGHTAKEACCACGGGDDPSRPPTTTTAATTAAPICRVPSTYSFKSGSYGSQCNANECGSCDLSGLWQGWLEGKKYQVGLHQSGDPDHWVPCPDPHGPSLCLRQGTVEGFDLSSQQKLFSVQLYGEDNYNHKINGNSGWIMVDGASMEAAWYGKIGTCNTGLDCNAVCSLVVQAQSGRKQSMALQRINTCRDWTFPAAHPTPAPKPNQCTVDTSQPYCHAKASATDKALGDAITWICSSSDVDCSPINDGGACNTVVGADVRSKCNWAFNAYYQKHKASQGSCDFGGSGEIVH